MFMSSCDFIYRNYSIEGIVCQYTAVCGNPVSAGGARADSMSVNGRQNCNADHGGFFVVFLASRTNMCYNKNRYDRSPVGRQFS